MTSMLDAAKRLTIGRKLKSDKLGDTLLPKRIAFPVFASDALSSNAYATQEILLVLSLGGIALLSNSVIVAMSVLVVMAVVVTSYRQNVHAYPSGGGDYEVVSDNLGKKAGLVVGSSLLVDYVLTVAVSISAAVDNIGSAFPFVNENKVLVAVTLIVLVTVINLRGTKESGLLFAIPTYGFLIGVFVMFGVALYRYSVGDVMLAPTSGYELVAEHSFTGFALVFLMARAFASGCTTLTGVEALSNCVPQFKHPKSKNAATSLLLLGLVSGTIFMGLTLLARLTEVKIAESPEYLIGLPEGAHQQTVITQIADAVFGSFNLGFLYISFITALILVLAANTAFSSFPVLGSILARDEFLPKQLHTRGDRLAFSNGIMSLAGAAILLVWIFDASVTRLIQLYILGVFISFTLSQLGMIKHWTKLLKETTGEAANKMKRSRIVNAVGFVITGSVVIIVLATKFTHGAWIVCLLIPAIWLVMSGINRHYKSVRDELKPLDEDGFALPSRTHAIILVSKIHKPTLRAIAYARASRPSTLEALTVCIDEAEADALTQEWDRREIPIPLRILASPYREMTRPILEYVSNIKLSSPRDLIVVFLPEYVVGAWWERLLHNQSALRLKTRLRLIPGVVVTNVPWQLESSERFSPAE